MTPLRKSLNSQSRFVPDKTRREDTSETWGFPVGKLGSTKLPVVVYGVVYVEPCHALVLSCWTNEQTSCVTLCI